MTMTDNERKLLQKSLQRVVCAANRMPDGTMFIGARHWDTHMHEQADLYKKANGLSEKALIGADQGFIDQFGNFLTREEAWKVAKRNNQIIRYCGTERGDEEEGYLFSEHLY